jgi:hypothetical protein
LHLLGLDELPLAKEGVSKLKLQLLDLSVLPLAEEGAGVPLLPESVGKVAHSN